MNYQTQNSFKLWISKTQFSNIHKLTSPIFTCFLSLDQNISPQPSFKMVNFWSKDCGQGIQTMSISSSMGNLNVMAYIRNITLRYWRCLDGYKFPGLTVPIAYWPYDTACTHIASSTNFSVFHKPAIVIVAKSTINSCTHLHMNCDYPKRKPTLLMAL